MSLSDHQSTLSFPKSMVAHSDSFDSHPTTIISKPHSTNHKSTSSESGSLPESKMTTGLTQLLEISTATNNKRKRGKRGLPDEEYFNKSKHKIEEWE